MLEFIEVGFRHAPSADIPIHATGARSDPLRADAALRQEPDLANSLILRTWRDGPQKDQQKIPKAIQSMLDRRLRTIGTNSTGRAAAFFTEAGRAGLPQLLQNRRVIDVGRFDHLRRALEVDDPPFSEG